MQKFEFELDKQFVEKYKDLKPPMTDLGSFVYYRTYSRFIEEEKRREFWWETVKRVVEYNCSLVPNVSQEEGQKLFDNIFNLRQFPSGRSLWVGGTKSAEKFGSSNFNCAFTLIQKVDDIAELFYLMMLGVGVGIRILPSDVEEFPKFSTTFAVTHKPFKEAKNKIEFTEVETSGRLFIITIGDSKEGWVEALRSFLKIITRVDDTQELDGICIELVYDNIRKKGEALKTFGGTASGHESLQVMFEKITSIIHRAKGKFKTIDILDICNLVGENVAVGGSRRTACLSMFDIDDMDVRHAKNEVFKQEEDGTWTTNMELLHRTKSNNSIVFYEKPSKDKLKEIFASIKVSGEPGFINGEVAKKRFKDFKGVNPCCFTGDMRLLTSSGYKTFKELEGANFEVIEKGGTTSEGKVWKVGTRECVEISLSNKKKLRCTPDHVFMTNEGEQEACSLKGKQLIPHTDTLLKVVNVKNTGKQEVYDFNAPKTNWGFVEDCLVHNCEILLPSKGFCNLTTINMCAFINEFNQLEREELLEACRLSARTSYRMACLDIELPEWNENQKNYMLTGCSLTGWQDAMNLLEFKQEYQKVLAQEMREVCHKEIEKFSTMLGKNKSANITTLKPEGSISLLPTVSPGLHFSHAPYYIRRVRVNSDDPILQVVKELGWAVNNEVGTDDGGPVKVVDFPCKAPKGKTKYDVSAIEQLEIYKMFMQNYVDQNASNTITVRPHEWDGVCEWVYENWNEFVGVSFLSLDDTYYPLAPYEAITEEKYNELVRDRKSFDVELLNKYIKRSSEEDELENTCTSGSCPIR